MVDLGAEPVPTAFWRRTDAVYCKTCTSEYRMIAASGFLTTLCAPKTFSAAARPRTPLMELRALPRPPTGLRALLLKGRRKDGAMGREKRMREGERWESEGKDHGPLTQIPGSAPEYRLLKYFHRHKSRLASSE